MILPILRRTIFDPLHASLTGSPRVQYWREMEQTQFLSLEELKGRQWEKLNRLYRFVNRRNAFYQGRFREAGIGASAEISEDEFRRIPILKKNEIRSSQKKMISDGFQADRLLKSKTGGSTGVPLELYFTEECSERRNGCARRHDRWAGWQVGERVGAVWGNPVLPGNSKERLVRWLVNPYLFLDTMHIDETAVREFASAWKKMRPTVLFGHAHSIFLLSKYIEALSLDGIRPKGIITSSMMLIPHERNRIENVFGVKVFDRYGCEEVSLIASECEMHKGMHLNIDNLIVEFIGDNGSPCRLGEPGKIVVTDLMNDAMPLIRYQVEDIGVPSVGACACGRGLPLMESVTGRTADFLIRKDGVRIAGISLIENTLTLFNGIEQMQIVQEDMETFLLNIVRTKGSGSEVEDRLRAYFQETFGIGIRVEIREMDSIPRELSGKYRFSVCKIPGDTAP